MSLDEARRRVADRNSAPFAALTFDDGYRDMVDAALPVLERHGAPFAVFCAIGFVEGGARLWWLELEEAIRRLQTIEVSVAGHKLCFAARTPTDKTGLFMDWSELTALSRHPLATIGAHGLTHRPLRTCPPPRRWPKWPARRRSSRRALA